MYVAGSNIHGEIGCGKKGGFTVPTPIEFFQSKEIKMVKCGYYHTFVVTKNDDFYVFGKNLNYQLGLGLKQGGKSVLSPTLNESITKILKKERIIHLECGHSFSILITESDGVEQLYAFGNNGYGQVGFPKGIECSQIKKNSTFDKFFNPKEKFEERIKPKITCLSCGGNHTLLCFDKKKLVGFGSNQFGQLLINQENAKIIRLPVTIELESFIFQEKRDEIKDIILGFNFSLIVISSKYFEDGEMKFTDKLYSCGENDGQLGYPKIVKAKHSHSLKRIYFDNHDKKRFWKIKTGDDHSICVLEDKKTIFVFGRNEYGQCGVPREEKYKVIVHPFQLKCKDFKGKLLDIEANGNFSILLFENNDIFVFGSNKRGQLAIGHRNYVDSPTILKIKTPISNVKAGFSHSIFITKEDQKFQKEIFIEIQNTEIDIERIIEITKSLKIENRLIRELFQKKGMHVNKDNALKYLVLKDFLKGSLNPLILNEDDFYDTCKFFISKQIEEKGANFPLESYEHFKNCDSVKKLLLDYFSTHWIEFSHKKEAGKLLSYPSFIEINRNWISQNFGL